MFEGIHTKVTDLYEDDRVPENELVDIVKRAHDEWKEAERLFQNVSDPDLVDHAIFRVEAAKARYIYLVKKAKEEGARANFY
ncbi:DUF2508 family protein [Serpentinicella alkaliphila]|nr:DUF2508 family protein [Serpentinicella alkaliphila]